MAVLAQMRQLVLDQLLGLVEFVHRRDHREHQLQLASARGLQQRADLAAHQARPVEAEPDRAPAERRVLFLEGAHVGQHLVAADIEGAEGDRLVAGGVQHRAIERKLLAGARKIRRHHELQFGAEQADAGGAGFLDMRQVDRAGPALSISVIVLAVLGDAGLVAQRAVLRLLARAQPHALGIGGLDIG